MSLAQKLFTKIFVARMNISQPDLYYFRLLYLVPNLI